MVQDRIVILENMELGIPVISTSVGNIAEHVLDAENSFEAPDADVKTFLEFAISKIEAINNDEFLYRKLAQNARLHAEKHFDIAVFKKNIKLFLAINNCFQSEKFRLIKVFEAAFLRFFTPEISCF